MSRYRFAKISGWSMAPILNEGDLIVFKKVDIRPGDVIIFKCDKIIIAHRLVEDNSLLFTKGDNSPRLDKSLKHRDILGVGQFVIKKDTGKIIHLNLESANRFLLKYSKIEIKTIDKISSHFKKDISGVIKTFLLPYYILNYCLFRIYAKGN